MNILLYYTTVCQSHIEHRCLEACSVSTPAKPARAEDFILPYEGYIFLYHFIFTRLLFIVINWNYSVNQHYQFPVHVAKYWFHIYLIYMQNFSASLVRQSNSENCVPHKTCYNFDLELDQRSGSYKGTIQNFLSKGLHVKCECINVNTSEVMPQIKVSVMERLTGIQYECQCPLLLQKQGHSKINYPDLTFWK